MTQEGVVFGIATVLIGLVIHKYGTAVLEAPITARKVDSGGLAAAALLTTFLAFVVERTLALLFESNLIRPRLKNLLFPFKEASALILTVQICLYYQIDMMQIVLDDPAPSWLGLLLTAFFVAGGAKGPLRMWEKMGVGNHTEEKEKKTKPKKKEVQRSTTASPSSVQP